MMALNPLDLLSCRKATCMDAIGWNEGLPPPTEWVLVGSAALYEKGEDVDIAALYPYPPSILGGWELCGKEYPGAQLAAYRKGKVNLLVFTNESEFHKMVAAQRACEYLVLSDQLPQDKKDLRVAIFKAVREVVL